MARWKLCCKTPGKNREFHFCLNCDDFIEDKYQVLNINWTLFDEQGNLRQDIWGCEKDGEMEKFAKVVKISTARQFLVV